MDSNILNSLIEMLPKEKEKAVFAEIQKKAMIPGFRPGKAPISGIRAGIQTNNRIQQLFLSCIFEAYYPSVEIRDIDPDGLDTDPEKLPGRLAGFFLKRPGDVREVWESMSGEIDAFRKTEEDAAPAEEKTSAAETGPETQTPAAESELPAVPEAPADELPDEEQVPVMPAVPEAAPDTDTEELEPEPEENSFSGSEYLGYIQVKRTQNGGIYYNFYPVAKIDLSKGVFVPLSFDEKLLDFPQYGNINIYSSGRMQDLRGYFENGRLYIIEIETYLEEDNYNAAGVLNGTQKKIDLKDLLEYHLLHDSHEAPYHYCQIIDIPNFSERIINEKQIQIEMEDPSIEPCEKVLFRDDEKRLIGPFTVKREWRRGEDSESYYVYPETKRNHYIFDVYEPAGKSEAFVTIPYEGSRCETEAVKLSMLERKQVDFASNDMLLRDLQQMYEQQEQNPDGTPDFSRSELVGMDIPEAIRESRKSRMESFIRQNTAQQQTLSYFTEFFARSLRQKFETEDPLFGDIISHLIQNPKFMNGISGSRILAEAQKAQQEEYEKLTAEVEKLKVQKDKVNEEIEALQAEKQAEMEVLRQEAQQNAQKKLEKLNNDITAAQNDLDSILARLEIAKDISNLRIEKAVAEREQQRLDKEKQALEDQIDDLKKQSGALLRQFRLSADETLARVADVKINEQIARMLASAGSEEKAAETEPDVLFRPVDEQIRRCAGSEEDDAAVMQRLVNCFKRYRINYPVNDILNLYICFTQGFLTVLSGEPGTGKTTACDILAHSLGLDTPVSGESRYVRVQVERGWSSKRDLIGYYNPLTKSFDQSNRGVFHALDVSDRECRFDSAEKVPPMAILLDEANLSQMEYYWSSFMNPAEQSLSVSQIDLGNGKVFRISRGLRFLATINNDHTTESLSPRLIDRSWVITLPEGGRFTEANWPDYEPAVSMETLLRIFGRPAEPEAKLDVYSEGILRDMYALCGSVKMNISNRTQGAVRNYCLAAGRVFIDEKNSGSGGVIAADFAVSQRILPMLRGNGQTYKQDVLNEFKHFFDDNNMTRSARILDRIISSGDRNMNYYSFFG